jgi:hypothetical protein
MAGLIPLVAVICTSIINCPQDLIISAGITQSPHGTLISPARLGSPFIELCHAPGTSGKQLKNLPTFPESSLRCPIRVSIRYFGCLRDMIGLAICLGGAGQSLIGYDARLGSTCIVAMGKLRV